AREFARGDLSLSAPTISSNTAGSPALMAYFTLSAQYVVASFHSTFSAETSASVTAESFGHSFSEARRRRIVLARSSSFPLRSYTKKIPFHLCSADPATALLARAAACEGSS